MTPQKLLELAERCEQARGLDDNLDVAIDVAFGGKGGLPRDHRWSGTPNFTSSIDAAMQLVGQDWFWRVGNDAEGPDPSQYRADVGHTKEGPVYISFKRSVATTPALAITAACLRAHASQSPEMGGGA